MAEMLDSSTNCLQDGKKVCKPLLRVHDLVMSLAEIFSDTVKATLKAEWG